MFVLAVLCDVYKSYEGVLDNIVYLYETGSATGKLIKRTSHEMSIIKSLESLDGMDNAIKPGIEKHLTMRSVKQLTYMQ